MRVGPSPVLRDSHFFARIRFSFARHPLVHLNPLPVQRRCSRTDVVHPALPQQICCCRRSHSGLLHGSGCPDAALVAGAWLPEREATPWMCRRHVQGLRRGGKGVWWHGYQDMCGIAECSRQHSIGQQFFVTFCRSGQEGGDVPATMPQRCPVKEALGMSTWMSTSSSQATYCTHSWHI